MLLSREISEVQGKKGPFSAEVNGEIPKTLNWGSQKEKDVDVRGNKESNAGVWNNTKLFYDSVI